MNSLSPIKIERIASRGPLGGRVHQILKEAIITGEIPPGTWLLEDQLTQAIGISRTPLREAFKRLESDGLIDIIPRKGAYTVELNRSELDELFEARECIETKFFCRSAKNMAAGDFQRFRESLKDAEKQMNDTKSDRDLWEEARRHYLGVDRAFHDALISACGNKYWSKLYHHVRDQIEIYGHRVSYVPDWFQVAIEDHYRILAALEDRKFVQARQFMTQHIRNMKMSVDDLEKMSKAPV